jgi:putative oxidoreductase
VSTTTDVAGVDLGLLVLRLVLGALLAGHGLQKAFGWFHGPGVDGAAALFDTWGFRPARPMVRVAACCEVLAATLFLLGLLTPVAAAVAVGTMVVAMAPNRARGLWAARGGYELPLLYATVGAGIGLTGPGRFSIDGAIGLPSPAWAGGAAVLLGLLAGLGPLARRRAALRADTSSTL